MKIEYKDNGHIVIKLNYKPTYNFLHDIISNDIFGKVDWIPIKRYPDCDTQLIYVDETQQFYYLINWRATLSLLEHGELILKPINSEKWMYDILVNEWDFIYFDENNVLFAPWDLSF